MCACREPCAECDGSRFVVATDGAYEVAKPCECAALHERVRAFNSAHIPSGYGDKALAGFDHRGGNQKEIKTRLLQYQKRFDPADARGLLLLGAPGTGKTHVMCSLVAYLTLERGVRCLFVDFFHLTARIRATYGKDRRAQEREEDILNQLVEVPVLAIDELGKGLGTTWELGIVDQIISRRYNAGRIVLATSNYLPEHWLDSAAADGRQASPSGRASRGDSLEERVGGRIFSRLAEMCDVLHIQGPDFRTQRLSG